MTAESNQSRFIIDFNRDLKEMEYAIEQDHQHWMGQQHNEALSVIESRPRVKRVAREEEMA